jgi:predicted PurR-regulated permease PerM
MNEEEIPSRTSPKWGSMTKMVIGLTIVAIIGALLIWFRRIIGPLILTFVLAYLLYPLVKRFSERVKISWRASVNLIYLVVVVVVVGLLTVAGLAVVQQVQSLLAFIQRFITDLPGILNELSTQVYQIGPMTIDLGELLNFQSLTNEILSILQSLLGQAGNLIRGIAGSAAGTLGWGLFVLVISYFLLSEAGKFPGQLVRIELPGYEYDLEQLGNKLRIVWNSFLRGQLIIILLVLITYSILLNILGVRFAFGIAVLAGIARFVPYIGPITVLIVTALVSYFQVDNYFGLQPVYYMLIVIIAVWLTDQIYDNLVSPRIFGQTLNVHPAAILIAALLFTNLIGVIGLVLAAPVVATINLMTRYVFRKMLDLDPWPESEIQPAVAGMAPMRRYVRLRDAFIGLWGKLRR